MENMDLFFLCNRNSYRAEIIVRLCWTGVKVAERIGILLWDHVDRTVFPDGLIQSSIRMIAGNDNTRCGKDEFTRVFVIADIIYQLPPPFPRVFRRRRFLRRRGNMIA